MTGKELIQRAIARGEIVPAAPVVLSSRGNQLDPTNKRRLAQQKIWTPQKREEHSVWMRALGRIRRKNAAITGTNVPTSP